MSQVEDNSSCYAHMEGSIPYGNLTQLWKITIFNGKIHYTWPIFNSYVKLPEGSIGDPPSKLHPSTMVKLHGKKHGDLKGRSKMMIEYYIIIIQKTTKNMVKEYYIDYNQPKNNKKYGEM